MKTRFPDIFLEINDLSQTSYNVANYLNQLADVIDLIKYLDAKRLDARVYVSVLADYVRVDIRGGYYHYLLSKNDYLELLRFLRNEPVELAWQKVGF